MPLLGIILTDYLRVARAARVAKRGLEMSSTEKEGTQAPPQKAKNALRVPRAAKESLNAARAQRKVGNRFIQAVDSLYRHHRKVQFYR